MQLELVGGKSVFFRNISGGMLIPTNYQVFNTRGVSFPISNYTCPAGIGHTLILDPQHCKVRTLSMTECWKLQGGSLEDYPKGPNEPEILGRILGGTHWGLQLYMAGLAYGAFFSLYSLVDSPNVGTCDEWYGLSRDFVFLDMPSPRREHRRDNRYARTRYGPGLVNTDRYGNPTRSHNPRRADQHNDDARRLEEIPRNLARLLRRAPKRLGAISQLTCLPERQ